MNLKLKDLIRENIVKTILAFIILIVPLALAIKWTNDAKQTSTESTQYDKAAKVLTKQLANEKLNEQKRSRNIPNVYKNMTDNTQSLIKTQDALMNNKGNYNTNIVNLKSVVSSLNILDNPHSGLIIDQTYTKNLKIIPSYAPSVKASDDTVGVTLLYIATKNKDVKGKPIYVVQADYNVLRNKFTNFNVITTFYTPLYQQAGKKPLYEDAKNFIKKGK